ncbi:MAG: SDR family oxidoreductase [Acidimicrobiia bacterium]
MGGGTTVVTGWGLLGQAVAKLAHDERRNVRVVGRSVVGDGRSWWRADLAREPLSPDAMRDADLLVHTAAMTSVIGCERDPDLARRVNADATRSVVDAAFARHVPVVYPSTDWVFDGARGYYSEVDAIAPINVYGSTKAQGEEYVLAHGGLIVRGSFVGARPDRRRGLRETLAGRASPRVARDRVSSPLWVGDYARALLQLAALDVSGVVHLGSASATTWETFCRAARELLVGTPDILPAPPDEVPRPHDTSLDARRAERLLGWSMPDWEDVCQSFAHEDAVRPTWSPSVAR